MTHSTPMIKKGLYQGVSQFIQRGSVFFLFILIERVWGEDRLGAFAVLWLLQSIFYVVADWGQQTMLTRDLANPAYCHKKRLAWATRLALGSGLVAAFIFWFVSRLVWPAEQEMASLLAMGLFLMPLQSVQKARLQAMGRWDMECLTVTAERGTLLLIVCFALIFQMGMLMVPLGIATGTLAGLIVGHVLIAKTEGAKNSGTLSTSPETRSGLIKEGAFLTMASLAAMAYVKGDILLLGIFRPDWEVGRYVMASNLVLAFGMVPQVFLAPWLPVLGRMNKDALRKWLVTAWGVAYLFGFLSLLILLMAGDSILGWIYGSAGVFTLLGVLACAEMLNTPNYVSGITMQAVGHAKLLSGIVGLGAIMNLGLNVWVIPHFGAMGAAFTTLLTVGMVSCMYPLVLIRKPKIWVVSNLLLLGFCGCVACWVLYR